VPVNSTHPDYDVKSAAWSRGRDVLAGEDAVKTAGERYLPRLDSQSEDEYAAYKARASFFGATARTLAEYFDVVFRRAPGVSGERERGAWSLRRRCAISLRIARHDVSEFCLLVTAVRWCSPVVREAHTSSGFGLRISPTGRFNVPPPSPPDRSTEAPKQDHPFVNP